jgi:hypothetical protein
MAISRFINSSIVNGFPKYQKLWDGIANAFGLRAGYLFGGNTDNTFRNIIQQLNFTTEANTTIAATLSNNLWQSGAFANSGVAGYSAGGTNGTLFSTTDKLNFITVTKSTTNPMPQALSGQLAHANSGVAGYIMGGAADPTTSAAIRKLTFSADTWSTISATLPTSNGRAAACANSGTAGYGFGGGNTNTIVKLLYSDETRSTLSATLTYGLYTSTATSNNGVAAYHHGGYNGNMITQIDKLTYSNETKSGLAALLASSYASADAGAFANSGIASYIAAGYNADGFAVAPSGSTSGSRSQINKLSHTTETISVISATTPYSNTNDHNGCANSAGL